MDFEDIAAVCHEANRRFCRTLGDDSQKSWEEAPWWQKQSAISGVFFVSRNSAAHPREAHENWLRQKTEEGWVYGLVKDDDAKVHPCMLPYDELPIEQQMKDHLFKAIALTLLTFKPTEKNHE